jgi:hypothetical protein
MDAVALLAGSVVSGACVAPDMTGLAVTMSGAALGRAQAVLFDWLLHAPPALRVVIHEPVGRIVTDARSPSDVKSADTALAQHDFPRPEIELAPASPSSLRLRLNSPTSPSSPSQVSLGPLSPMPMRVGKADPMSPGLPSMSRLDPRTPTSMASEGTAEEAMSPLSIVTRPRRLHPFDDE